LSALECFRTPNHPYLHGEPLPGRGQPVKAEAAQRRRVCASLEGLAPVRPNQDMQAKAVGSLLQSQPDLPFPAEAPFNAAVIAPDAADVVVEALLQDRLPGDPTRRLARMISALASPKRTT